MLVYMLVPKTVFSCGNKIYKAELFIHSMIQIESFPTLVDWHWFISRVSCYDGTEEWSF